MITAHCELLPESYLLLLMPGPPAAPGQGLAQGLRCAGRSRRPAVWVDCGLLTALPAEDVRLLWACHRRLHAAGRKLVVAHASTAVRQHLLAGRPGAGLRFAATLCDAAWYTGRRPVA